MLIPIFNSFTNPIQQSVTRNVSQTTKDTQVFTQIYFFNSPFQYFKYKFPSNDNFGLVKCITSITSQSYNVN